jgi:transcription elongation factor GreB
MSRAFLKEDSAESPVIIPPRAALPAGTPNYVTRRGLQLLRDELAQLQARRAQAEAGDHDDRTRQLALLNGQLGALIERLNSAKVVDTGSQPADQVRFGATVTLHIEDQGSPTEQRFTIVGVDEASVAEGMVAFVAPVARVLQGARVGQTVTLPRGREAVKATVIAIACE